MRSKNILPIFSKDDESEVKIDVEGTVYFVHNLKPKYSEDERTMLIISYKLYTLEEQEAYRELMWYLFPQYLKEERLKLLN